MKPAIALIMEIMGEELDRLYGEIDQLNSRINNQRAEQSTSLSALGFLNETTKTLSSWLGESHADMHVLLNWLERAQGNIPAELRKFIKEARARLTKRENAFLKEFGDMNEPGEN